jgi:hypothetical protein
MKLESSKARGTNLRMKIYLLNEDAFA